MTVPDPTWVREQLVAGRVSQVVGTSVLRLLAVWGDMNHTDLTAKETVDVFSKLALGHALVDPDPDTPEVWYPAQPGFVKVADTVRVRADAYSGSLGPIHNGRVCRVVAIRSGDIIVNSIDDRAPKLEGTHYSPFLLEKRVSA